MSLPLRDALRAPFDSARWRELLGEIFASVEFDRHPVAHPVPTDRIRACREFGRVKLADGRGLVLLEIEIGETIDLLRNRVELRNLVARFIDQDRAHGVLAVIRSGPLEYRLTFASRVSEFDAEAETFRQIETATRRFTYVLGHGHECHTASHRLSALAAKRATATLDDVIAAFNVEPVSNEFFARYKEHYTAFCAHLLASDAPARVFGLALHGLNDKARDRALKPVRDFVKKLLGRIVFLHFLQKKGWLGCPAARTDWHGGDPRFLLSLFAACAEKDRFHSRCLAPLFFDTLNHPHRPGHLFPVTGTRIPYLNGGLFERDFPGVERVDFPAPLFAGLLEFFGQYHFTIDENDPDDHEIGIDPEMLSHIFENLLEDNKDKGAYYTPKAVVQYMCQQSLIHALCSHFEKEDAPALPGSARVPRAGEGVPPSRTSQDVATGSSAPITPDTAGSSSRRDAATSTRDARAPQTARREIEKLIRHKEPIDARDSKSWLARHATRLEAILDALKICDPAIGSGAFPIGLLQEIFWTKMTLHPGANRAVVKRAIIQNSIHGVDLDGGAVEIARLRFWLALIVDEDEPLPLPNLDYQIMQGNSLLESFEGIDLSRLSEPARVGIQLLGSAQGEFGLAAEQTEMTDGTASRADLADLQQAYFDCHDPEEKARLRARIDDAVLRAIDFEIERRREALAAVLENWTREIARKKRANKGQYEATAAEEKKRAAWQAELAALTAKSERLHKLLAAPRAERPFFLWHLWFREIFADGGFDIVIANPPYGRILTREVEALVAAQYPEFAGTYDIFVAFVLHAFALLHGTGILTFIVPTAWLGGPYYADFRRRVLARTIEQIVVLPFDIFQEAYVDTLIVVASAREAEKENRIRAFTYPKKAKPREIRPDPWEYIPLDSIQKSRDGKILLTSAMVGLRDRIGAACNRTFRNVVEIKRGVLFDKSLLCSTRPNSQHHPYFEGDVYRYEMNYVAPSWVEFGPKMKERPSEFRWFEGDRILLRRLVNRRQRLMAALASDTFITNKNLYTALPHPGAPSLKTILAILNSSLVSKLYIDAVSQATKDDFPQVTITDVSGLPFPTEVSTSEQATLSALVDRILAAKRAGDASTVAALEAEIDTHVFRLYGLTAGERTLIEGAAK